MTKEETLRKKLWKKDEQIKELETELGSLRELSERMESRKADEHALLFGLDGPWPQGLTVKFLSLGQFNTLLRNPDEFVRRNGLGGNAAVFRLWDRGDMQKDLILLEAEGEGGPRSYVCMSNEELDGLKKAASEVLLVRKDLAKSNARAEKLESSLEQLRKKYDESISSERSDDKKKIKELHIEITYLKERLSEKQRSRERSLRPANLRGDRRAPIREGDRMDLMIESLGKGGDGCARVNNFIIFVPGTRPGQQVRVEITRVAQRCAFGRTL